MKKRIWLILLCVTSCTVKHSNDYVKHSNYSRPAAVSYDNIKVLILGDQTIDFRGVHDYDNEVGANSILYPGVAGVWGGLAQIFTHVSLNANSQSKKLEAQQLEANKILSPFNLFLSKYKQRDLHGDNAIFKFISAEDAPLNTYFVSEPIFFISQDLNYIVLKHKIRSQDKSNKESTYSNLVEVISDPLSLTSQSELEAENGATHIIETARNLYAKSLKLIQADLKGELDVDEKEHKSHRVYLGRSFRVERGSSLEFDSEDILIRNLRGWLISYPVSLSKPPVAKEDANTTNHEESSTN